MIAVHLARAIGNPISALLLGLDGYYGLAGWQWVFLLEGLSSVLIGLTPLAPDGCGARIEVRPASTA
jgi:ACS family tartrate transporter-like MFS transporter